MKETNSFIEEEEEKDNQYITREKKAIYLDGTNSLVIKRLLVTCKKSDCKKEEYETISKEELGELVYPLTEVSQEQLFLFRLSGIPGFVLKMEDSLYYTKVPKKCNLSKIQYNFEGHLCGLNSKVCSHLSPSLYEGGCEKVSDRSIEFYSQPQLEDNFVSVLRDSKRIEKYDFIRCGVESFNTSLNVFIVFKCANYEFCSKSCKEAKVHKKTKVPRRTKVHRKPRAVKEKNKTPASESFWKDMSF